MQLQTQNLRDIPYTRISRWWLLIITYLHKAAIATLGMHCGGHGRRSAVRLIGVKLRSWTVAQTVGHTHAYELVALHDLETRTATTKRRKAYHGLDSEADT